MSTPTPSRIQPQPWDRAEAVQLLHEWDKRLNVHSEESCIPYRLAASLRGAVAEAERPEADWEHRRVVVDGQSITISDALCELSELRARLAARAGKE